MGYKCNTPTIKFVQGSEREVYAEWTNTTALENATITENKKSYSIFRTVNGEYKYFEGYETVWWYWSNNRWFAESPSTLKWDGSTVTRRTSSFSVPEHARKVIFKVRPISKDKKSNDSSGKWFTGDWVETKAFDMGLTNIPTVKLAEAPELSLITSETEMSVKAAWVRKHNKGTDPWFNDGYLGGWTATFRYCKDNAWHPGDEQSIPRDALHTTYVIEPGTTEVKFKIKPEPVGSYFVGGESSWVYIKTGRTARKPDVIDIEPLAKTDRTYVVSWYFTGSDVGITGFNYEWQYFRKDGTWMSVQTGSVEGTSFRKKKVTLDYIKGASGMLMNGGTFEVKYWQTYIDIDATASAFRIRVKPESNLDKIAYTESWSTWKNYDIKPVDRHCSGKTLEHVEETKNTYRASWTIADTTDVASFDYEWRYFYTSDGPGKNDKNTAYAGGSGSVAVSEANKHISKDEETDEKRWAFTFNRPENARYLQFRVKPVARYASSFTGEFYDWKSLKIDIKKVQATNVQVAVRDAVTGMLVATWDEVKWRDSKKKLKWNVDSYEYEWRYTLKSSPDYYIVDKTGSVGTATSPVTRVDYTPKDNTAKVKFLVKPKALYDDEFEGEYTNAVVFEISKEIPKLECVDIAYSFRPKTNRTIDVGWTVDNDSRRNIKEFEYSWDYRLVKGGRRYIGETKTVSVDAYPEVGDRTPKNKWYGDLEFPENAYEVMFRVKAVPVSALAFISGYSAEKSITWDVLPRTVTNVHVRPLNDLTDRKVFATWNFDTTGVSSEDYTFTIRWSYLMITAEAPQGRWWFESDRSENNIDNKSDPYDVPEGASEARVTVQPVPEYESSFIPDWSAPASLKIEPENIQINVQHITLRRYSEDTRRMVVEWSFPSPTYSSENDISHYTPSSYSVEWEYFANETWFTTTNSVDGDATRLQDIYDCPDEAKEVHVRVKPVYDDTLRIGDWSEITDRTTYVWDIVPREISDLNVYIQRGSQRTVVATWTISSEVGVDSYNYEWRYKVDDVWFSSGGSGSSPVNTPSCTYDAPENASHAAVRVKAVPITSTYFIEDWSEEASIEIPLDTMPETPQVPNASINGFTLNAYLDTYDNNTERIEFEIVNKTSVVNTIISDVKLNRASISTDVAVGNGYRVRARGINAEGGYGEWSQYTSDYIYTIPKAITSIDVAATSSTSAELNWNIPDGMNGDAGSQNQYTVEYTTKAEYFDAAASQVRNVTSPINKAIITDLKDSENGMWFFRTKATNSAGDSAWSKIVSVVVGKKPDAPTTWSSTVTATVTREVYLFWVHNAEDGSREQQAELEITVNGTTTVRTIPKDSDDGTTSYYLISAGTYNTGAKINWRVRTKGAVEEYGDWSVMREVEIFAPPTLSLYFISGFSGGVLTSYPLQFEVTAGPNTQTPIGYSVSIISNSTYEGTDDTGTAVNVVAGQTIFNRYFINSSPDVTFEISPGDAALVNLMNYTLRVVVSMDSGLTAEAEQNFSVTWNEQEHVIDAGLNFDRRMHGMYITPYCMDLEGNLASDVTMAVYRRNFDGGFTKIKDGLVNDGVTTIIDPHPALDYGRYRIVARSNTTGFIEYYDIPDEYIGETSLILQWDERWESFDTSNPDSFASQPWSGSVLKLPFNVKIADSNTVDSQLVEYIGRKHPVSYYGTQLGQKLTLNADIALTDTETIYALRRLAVWMGDVYVREPSGSGYWGKVEVSFSQTRTEVIIPVTINVTRVEGGV